MDLSHFKTFNIFVQRHLPYQFRTLSVSDRDAQPQLPCGFWTQINLSVNLISTTHELKDPGKCLNLQTLVASQALMRPISQVSFRVITVVKLGDVSKAFVTSPGVDSTQDVAKREGAAEGTWWSWTGDKKLSGKRHPQVERGPENHLQTG